VPSQVHDRLSYDPVAPADNLHRRMAVTTCRMAVHMPAEHQQRQPRKHQQRQPRKDNVTYCTLCQAPQLVPHPTAATGCNTKLNWAVPAGRWHPIHMINTQCLACTISIVWHHDMQGGGCMHSKGISSNRPTDCCRQLAICNSASMDKRSERNHTARSIRCHVKAGQQNTGARAGWPLRLLLLISSQHHDRRVLY
jgi:hypothetical protein